jgi:hypothetical protein
MVKFFFLWAHFDFYDTKPNFADSHVLVSIYEDTVKDYRYQRSLNAEKVFRYLYGDKWEELIKDKYPSNVTYLQLSSIMIDEILNLY